MHMRLAAGLGLDQVGFESLLRSPRPLTGLSGRTWMMGMDGKDERRGREEEEEGRG